MPFQSANNSAQRAELFLAYEEHCAFQISADEHFYVKGKWEIVSVVYEFVGRRSFFCFVKMVFLMSDRFVSNMNIAAKETVLLAFV